MDFWLVVGIFLLGCGLGSLVTAALYLRQLRKVKNYLRTASTSSLTHTKDCSLPANRDSEKRSA